MRLVALALMALLTACGGGGQSDAPPAKAVQIQLPFVAIDGDSLADNATTTWPAQLAAQYPATYKDGAIAGSLSYRPLAAYDSAFHSHPAGVYILVVGTNDLQNGLAGIPDTIANLRTTWAKARADGYRVVAFTLANGRAFQGQDDATALAFRDQLNTLIRASASSYDALVELDKLLPDQDDATVYRDGVHFTDKGSAIVANAVHGAITSR